METNLQSQAYKLFQEYFNNSSSPNDFYNDSMELLRGICDEKEIEFDEYFHTRWEDSINTIISFDEVYFDDPDKRDLYVFLSAKIDDQIFDLLKFLWEKRYDKFFTYEMLESEINKLLEKGTRF